MHLQLLLLGALAATATAVPSPGTHGSRPHVVHEERAQAPRSWIKRNAVPGEAMLPMRIGLKQRNLERGHDLLMDVANHASPNYGRHYTAAEVIDLFAPEEATVAAVRAWLEGAGIAPGRISLSANKAWLQFDAKASEAEALLRTEYHFYEHHSSDVNIACDRYHVPADVQSHIDYITPGLKLLPGGGDAKSRKRRDTLGKRGAHSFKTGPVIRRPLPSFMDVQGIRNGPLNVCDYIITPECIKALYKVPDGTKAAPGNALGIYETGGPFSQVDLDVYFALFAPTIPPGTQPELVSIDGGIAPFEAFPPNLPGKADTEPSLDLQVAFPLVWPQGTVDYQVDDYYYTMNYSGYIHAGLFNNLLDAIDGSYCTRSAFGETGNDPSFDFSYPDNNPGGYRGNLQCGVYNATNVISISYSFDEYDVGMAYQQRQCSEWMKLGLQGVSVLVASGDQGVGGRTDQFGHANGCLGDGTIFSPSHPVSCPYVTTVGSVFLPPGTKPRAEEEVAATNFASGGGFSNIYPRPSYQDKAVTDYFDVHAPPMSKALPYYETAYNKSLGAGGGVYNRAGRGFPDVSANGDNYMTIVGGQPYLIGGTSQSAPIFASILNRINEELIAANKSTVGFVNPVLYAHPEVLHDITVGDNSACDGRGFNASVGWDPVTGLGTPNYPAMLDLFKRLKGATG